MYRCRTTSITANARLAASLFLAFCFVAGKTTATTCNPEPTDMSIAYGEQITCVVDTAGDSDLFRFSGNAGDKILAESLLIAGDLLPRIMLIAPDGTTLGDRFNPARIDSVLPETGTYTAIINDNNSADAGEYTLTIFCTAGSCTPAPPSPPPAPPIANRECPPEPTDIFLQYGERVTCDVTPWSDNDLFRFSGNAGDRILAESLLVDGDLLPRIVLIAPDATTLGDRFNPARIDSVLPETGTYTVIMGDNNSADVGKYALTISCTGGDCLPVDLECSSGDIDGNGTIDALTDGLLVIRYMAGFKGPTLTEGAVAPDCTICEDGEIEACLASFLSEP